MINEKLDQIEAFMVLYQYDDAWQIWLRHESLADGGEEPAFSRYEWLKTGGDLGRMVGDWGKAEAAYLAAINLLEVLDDDQLRADTSASLASVWRAQSRFAEALNLYEEVEEIYSYNNDYAGLAFVYWGMGGVYRFSGQLPAALASFETAYRIADEQGAEEAGAYAACGLGGSYRASGKYDKSFAWYQEANKRMHLLGDLFGQAYSYCGIGNALRMQQQWVEAEENFVKAADLYKQIGDKVSYAYTLWSQATLLKCTQRLAEAARMFEEALVLFAEVHDERGKHYAQLGLLELQALSESVSRKQLADLVEQALRLDLQLEAAYARTLMGCVLQDAAVLKVAQDELQESGSTFFAKQLPLNLP